MVFLYKTSKEAPSGQLKLSAFVLEFACFAKYERTAKKQSPAIPQIVIHIKVQDCKNYISYGTKFVLFEKRGEGKRRWIARHWKGYIIIMNRWKSMRVWARAAYLLVGLCILLSPIFSLGVYAAEEKPLGEAENTMISDTSGDIEALLLTDECRSSQDEKGEVATEAREALSDNIKVGSRLYELFFGNGKKCKSLIVGGEVFGAKIKQKYVSVVESERIPALRSGDIILSVNGKEVKSSGDVRDIVNAAHGESVTLRARHRGSDIAIEVRPTLEDGEYRLGLTLRDGAMGIGTLTFIDPETGAFGGLGHGICDAESGAVIDMENGTVSGVLLSGIHRGECGKPGELSGILTEECYGKIETNSDCGVFGVLSDTSLSHGELLPVACRDEIKEGAAEIVSTLKNGKCHRYSIEITDIDRDSLGPKSFRVKVTDPTLKALTGGIIRGMSGSPIIQDGKLVGAVTHVMIADPTEGYGIFIENMLNAAQSQVQPKAA